MPTKNIKDKKKKKGKKSRQQSSTETEEEMTTSEEEESNDEEESSSDDSTGKKKMKKKVAKLANEMAKPKTSIRPQVWCTKCGNEGHTKEECRLATKHCEICITSTNHTMVECYYNGKMRRFQQQRAEPVVEVATVNVTTPPQMRNVPPPLAYRPRRELVCFYYDEKGHRKTECPYFLSHVEQMNEIKAKNA